MLGLLKKNEFYEMLVTDLGKNGEGIGRVDNFTLFVEGVLPGDFIKIETIRIKKTYGFARLIEMIKPSPYRIEPKCPVSRLCGGCTLQELDFEEQLKLKTKTVNDNLERIGGFKNIKTNGIIGMDNPYYYRNKAQYAIGEKNGKPIIGFYSAKTHDVIDIEDCCIQHPINKHILSCIKEYIVENKISIYDGRSNTGLIRNIMTRVGYGTNEIMVCIIINGSKLPDSKFLVDRLVKIKGMKSIAVNINKDKTNTAHGKKSYIIWGTDCICDTIEDIKFEISPQSFFQVNSLQTQALYRKVLDFAGLNGDEIVIDAYCGIGTISLFLAQRAKQVYGIEIVESAVEDAKRNAELNNISNVEFYLGESEIVIPALYEKKSLRADIVVVDPPRKGCEQKLLSTILSMEPNRIIYISCDSATLSRDLRILCQEKYRIERIQSVDMFPMTGHVEVVIKLQRKDCL